MRPDLYLPSQELVESGFSSLLQNHAHLMGAYLQLWTREISPVLSEPSLPPANLATQAAHLAERSLGDNCDHFKVLADGRHIFSVPIWSQGEILWILTTIPAKIPAPESTPDMKYRSGVTDDVIRPCQTARAEVKVIKSQSGLMIKDLARVLGHHMTLSGRIGAVDDEISGLKSEISLLNQISNRLTNPGNARQTIDFIMRQGCSITDSDLAILQLPESKVPMITRNPLQATHRIQLTRKALRQLAGQLWWGMRNWSTPLVHGSLSEILGSPAPITGATQVTVGRIHPDLPKAGFFALIRTGIKPYSSNELKLLTTLIEQISLALKNADLHENVTGFLMSTVKALVSAIETKDRYTSGHSSRVNLISMLLGKHLGLSGSDLESLKWASILHDVGKIGMPESILNKPGRLDETEFEFVKQHPGRGYEVLSHIPQLKSASQAVLFHHERIDGGGYPLGISGNAIPIPARIIAVADTFDALTSNRPYREARTEEEAQQEIIRVRGSQLDAQVVDAFVSMIPFLKEHRVMLGADDTAA